TNYTNNIQDQDISNVNKVFQDSYIYTNMAATQDLNLIVNSSVVAGGCNFGNTFMTRISQSQSSTALANAFIGAKIATKACQDYVNKNKGEDDLFGSGNISRDLTPLELGVTIGGIL